jgi:hypothetical protein
MRNATKRPIGDICPHCGRNWWLFFGYDPSKRGFESLIYMEGENSPSDETGGKSDEDNGTEEQGFGDNTESAGGKSLSVWCGKRFGLRWVRTVLMGRRGRLFKSLTWIIIMLS